MRSEYWRNVMAGMYVLADNGTDEEQEATWKLMDQIHAMDMEMYGAPETPLEEAWYNIKFLIFVLQLMNYRDPDQIEKIVSIAEHLIAETNLRKEPWSLRESILEDLYENDWYDEYGVYSILQILGESLCTNKKERQIALRLRQEVGIE